MFVRLLLLMLVVAASAGTASAAARAQPAVTVNNTAVENGYPRNLTFRLDASTDVPVEGASLQYSVVAGASGFERADLDGVTDELSLAVEVKTDEAGSFIPVGSLITFHWELETADGDRTTTEPEEFVYLPPDREWESLEGDIVTVYFHGDRGDLAERYAEAVDDTMERIGRELLGTELEVTPVRLVLFASEAEMDPARPGEIGSFEAATLTCGIKFNAAVLFAIPESCGTGDITDTVRHEFAHILTESAGEGPLSVLPAWLDEGTAVLAQSEPGAGYLEPFEGAARTDQFIPFSQMTTGPTMPRDVGLFYGQSYEMVRFLLDRGGQESFAELFATIKDGTRYDRAIEEVYGLTLAGFENEFRAAHGLDRREITQDEPTVTPVSPAQQAPTEPAGQQQQGSGEDDGNQWVLLALVLLATVFALLAFLAFLLLQILSRSRREREGRGRPGEPWSPGGGDDRYHE